MFDWKTLVFLFGRRTTHPSFPDIREVKEDRPFWDSLTRGLSISGNPGSGKTTTGAAIGVEYCRQFPHRSFIALDDAGAFTNKFLQIVEALPPEDREQLKSRIVVDMLGYQYVIPKPLFHADYGLTKEELVEKAASILEQLNPEKIEQNPTMATAIEVTARRLFDLIVEIKDDLGRPWQATEAARLLVDVSDGENIQDKGLLARALYQFGDRAPGARFYLENEVMRSTSPAARESRRGSLIVALNVLETDYMRARYGWPQPGITYREIIDNGLIYLVSGEMLSNQRKDKGWVFWDEFASLRALIQNRIPDNPDDKPVLLLIDEAVRLFRVKGMAEAIGDVPTYYRSRKLMPVIIIQAFWQLEGLLEEQYWNLGNLMTFQMDNLNDAYKIAQQLFPYSARETKYDAPSERSNPLVKTDREQYLEEANWIQRLGKRRVLMRRYLDETNKEPFVAFVNKTKHVEMADLNARQLFEIKMEMVRRSGRAVHVRDALREINKRDIVIEDRKERTGVPRRQK